MKKTGRPSGTMRKRFIRWTVVALFVSVVVGGLLVFLRVDDEVAIFNLWVDIVVGIFTIWGLAWAATEFAEYTVRPDVRILVGNPRNPPFLRTYGVLSYALLETPPFQVSGWRKVRMMSGAPKPIANLACGLYLNNEKSRAGRYVCTVIRVRVDPKPSSCRFVHGPFQVGNREILGELDVEAGYFTLAIQFADELIVYQSPVLVGELFLLWEKDLSDKQLPRSVVLDYDTYTLDGASHGKTELSILEWNY